jgi:hypothetical protein
MQGSSMTKAIRPFILTELTNVKKVVMMNLNLDREEAF